MPGSNGTRWTIAAVVGLAVLAGAPASGQGVADTSDAVPDTVPLIDRAVESRSKGSGDAAVTVFEVADFQCPFCARFAATIGRELDRRYVRTGKVQWVFVNLPLHTHARAWVAAEAALCAGATGGSFWGMHDRLFAEQRRWSRLEDPGPLFASFASELEVPAEAYQACVAADRVAPLILQDFASAVGAGITGTPTFLIMKGDTLVERLMGVGELEEWTRILDAILSQP